MDPSFLAYLGIQRKDSTDDCNKSPERKAMATASALLTPPLPPPPPAPTVAAPVAPPTTSPVTSAPGPKAKKSFKPSQEESAQAKRLSMDQLPTSVSTKRKVGVHQSGLAFLGKKAKLAAEPPSTSPSAAPAASSLGQDEIIPKASADVGLSSTVTSSTTTTTATSSADVSSSENSLSGEPTPPLLPTLAPRRAKQLAQEANEKVFNKENGDHNSSSSSLQPQNQQPQQPQIKCVCDCDCPEDDLKPANRKPGLTYNCQAVESVGGSRVGCRNKVTDFRYRKTASFPVAAAASNNNSKLQQKIANRSNPLCDSHIKRLKAHQACVYCGEFCAHGIFMLCRPSSKSTPHLFHRNCFMKDNRKQCPHCKCPEKPIAVQLKLQMGRMPVNLLQSVSKMSFPKNRAAKKSDPFALATLRADA